MIAMIALNGHGAISSKRPVPEALTKGIDRWLAGECPCPARVQKGVVEEPISLRRYIPG